MVSLAPPARLLPFASSGWFQGVGIGVLIVAVIFIAIVVVGFTILLRRRQRSWGSAATAPAQNADLEKRANILLVRLDDAVAAAENELGFAVAQFGDDRSSTFAAAVAEAKTNRSEAFALTQQRDDATPESATKRRGWTERVIHLCEDSLAALTSETATFDGLRRRETDAPVEVRAVRMLVVTTSMRVPAAELAVGTLTRTYSPAVVAPVSGNVTEARALLVTAADQAASAEAGITAGDAPVGDTLQQAKATVARAVQLLDAVDQLAASVASEAARLADLTRSAEADLGEGRAARDSAPDPDSSAAIGGAVSALERVLAASDPADPSASIGRIQEAVAGLDTALAGARNQAQRLEHASAALVGTLVTARSQIAATEEFIAARRGDIGADARTRLAEARRLLTVAEAQSDPIAALDTARSSATYSRDADALARYDVER